MDIFISYAPEDAQMLSELEKRLALIAKSGSIRLLHRGKIGGGQNYDSVAASDLEAARIVLLLVSPDFLASAECSLETNRALRRSEAGNVRVIPVLLRDSDWQHAEFRHLQPLPTSKIAVQQWTYRDEAWQNVISEIRNVIESMPSASERASGHAAVSAPDSDEMRAARAAYLREVTEAAALRPVLAGLDENRFPLADVRIPLKQANGDNEESLNLLLDWLRSPPRDSKTVLVLGEVGSGKTELMATVAAEIAEAASSNDDSPIPLLIEARRLLNHGLEQAAQDRWPVVMDAVCELLGHRSSRWVVLVDGLDEAGPHGLSAVQALQRLLGDRLHALAIASRPSMRPLIPSAIEIWLRAWSSEDVNCLLDRWANHDPKPVRALRASPQWSSIARICANPLMTTLCLVAACNESSLLHSRAGVYTAVIDHFVQIWARERAARTGMKVEQEQVIATLQELALEIVRRERVSVSRSELRSMLRRSAPNAALALEDTLERQIGLLVPRGANEYDFAIRGCAEYLAGRALAAMGDDAVVDAAYTSWGEEACRHAIGWVALQDPARAVGLVRCLLVHEKHDLQLVLHASHLRPVRVAIRAAADLGDLAAPVSEALTGACLHRLLDETSVWVGDRIADAVHELANAGGPCWDRIESLLTALMLMPEAITAHWYHAQSWKTPEAWVQALFHQDADVRCIALERLSAWVDDPSVRQLIEWELYDEAMSPGSVSPALVAGLSLRSASRDDSFAALRRRLLDRLESGGQLIGAAAALALRPDEAPAMQIVTALKHADQGYTFPPGAAVVLRELGDDPEGKKALDEKMPSWNRFKFIAPRLDISQDLTRWKRPPPSSRVYTRLCKAMVPRIHSMSAQHLQRILDHYPEDAVHSLFAGATEHPERVEAILRAYVDRGRGPIFWSDEEALGRAAVRHRSLRESLLRLWRTMKENSTWSGTRSVISQSYPGRALHWLVMEGDEEAIHIYAEWLPGSREMGMGSFRPRAIPAEILKHEPIKRAALAIKDHVWQEATEGRDNEQGHRIKLMATTAGSVLHCMWPLWIHDEEFCSGLMKWLEGDDVEQFRAVLLALQGLSLPAKLASVVPAAMSRWANNPPNDGINHSLDVCWEMILRFMRRSGVAPELNSWLRRLVEERTRFALHAACILIPHVEPTDAAGLSRAAAESPWGGWNNFDPPEDYHCQQLVAAAPDAWATAVTVMICSAPLYVAGRILPLFNGLPNDFKHAVARVWMKSAESLELPWTNEGSLTLRTVRPADRIRQILFDLGLENDPIRSEQEAGDVSGQGDR